MLRYLLISFLLLQVFFLFAQNNVIIVNDSTQYGFNRPRIALLNNDIPFVIWGKQSAPAKVYGSKLIGNNFGAPVQVVPDSMAPRVGTVDGPNIVAYNDSIYVAWDNQSSVNHHVFLNKSSDAGVSFSPAIQVDSVASGNNIEYPGVSISNNGTLGFYFIKSDASFNNPKQVLITSYDRGQSFSTEDTSVTSFSPGQACECCQGSMEMNDSNWVFYYRNNVSNVRNVYNLVSSNSGNTFNGVYELDLVDYVTNTCPSSGPEGHINGNKSFTAWMSRGSGSYRILTSVVNMANSTTSPATFIDGTVASNVSQNYPAVGGSGDTVAVIWQDNRYTFSHVFTAFSIDGGLTFTPPILISDTSINASYTNGDVAFANGKFHFVWKGFNKIYYKSATISNLLSIADSQSALENISIYPNPAKNVIEIKTTLDYHSIIILDGNGKLVQQLNNTKPKIDISDLSSGMYFIKLITKDNSIAQKFIKE